MTCNLSHAPRTRFYIRIYVNATRESLSLSEVYTLIPNQTLIPLPKSKLIFIDEKCRLHFDTWMGYIYRSYNKKSPCINTHTQASRRRGGGGGYDVVFSPFNWYTTISIYIYIQQSLSLSFSPVFIGSAQRRRVKVLLSVEARAERIGSARARREGVRERPGESPYNHERDCICVCVCVCGREKIAPNISPPHLLYSFSSLGALCLRPDGSAHTFLLKARYARARAEHGLHRNNNSGQRERERELIIPGTRQR